MVAVQKDYWYFMVLMMSLCLLKGSVQVKAPETTVTLQEGMILDCLCPWSGQLTMVSWNKASLSQPVAVYHPQLGTNFAPSYDGRVAFLKTTPMDGSISIMNVSQSDIGQYYCSLQTYPQGSWTKKTFVKKSALNISIQPDTELVAAENDNLTIKCDHIQNGEVYHVSIEKLGPEDGRSTIIATCQMHDEGMEMKEFSSRGSLNCSDAMLVSLHLTNIIEEDGGLYRCNFTTDAGVQSTTVLLTTLSAQDLGSFRYILYVYIGAGVIGGAFLMGLILLVTWVNRRKKKREEYRIKLHPGKRQQRNHYERACVYDRMKKGTRIGARDKEIYVNLHIVRAHEKQKRKQKR
ncbi:CD226 antigen isoform X1 [Triplophysa dalaica]|uniref:CD226 antigen isoform X1 n=1 Tax=Triplophysa dalaica TaxID=1582913 RepID=UPI0024E03EF6|nr:CD226 antigen isoform X1 [Triplophysa dalaica]